jgi:hypothetical protein
VVQNQRQRTYSASWEGSGQRRSSSHHTPSPNGFSFLTVTLQVGGKHRLWIDQSLDHLDL